VHASGCSEAACLDADVTRGTAAPLERQFAAVINTDAPATGLSTESKVGEFEICHRRRAGEQRSAPGKYLFRRWLRSVVRHRAAVKPFRAWDFDPRLVAAAMCCSQVRLVVGPAVRGYSGDVINLHVGVELYGVTADAADAAITTPDEVARSFWKRLTFAHNAIVSRRIGSDRMATCCRHPRNASPPTTIWTRTS